MTNWKSKYLEMKLNYINSKNKGGSNMTAEERRFDYNDQRKKAQAYTWDEFVQHYGPDNALRHWNKSPIQGERRYDIKDQNQGKQAYTWDEFKNHYGNSKALRFWQNSPVQGEYRIAPDGKSYTYSEFGEHFRGNAYKRWRNASVVHPQVEPMRSTRVRDNSSLPQRNRSSKRTSSRNVTNVQDYDYQDEMATSQWSCKNCTFLNSEHADVCAMCGTPRPSEQVSRESPFQRELPPQGSPAEGSTVDQPTDRTQVHRRTMSPEQNYSINNGLLSVFQHETNTIDLINELVRIESGNNEYYRSLNAGDSRVVRLINIYISNDGQLFYSADDFADLLRTPSDQQLLPTDDSRNLGRKGFSQQKTAAPYIMSDHNLKRMLLTHIQEIIRESQINHADLFSNCTHVMVTIDIYLNRLYSQSGFHHDSTGAFPSKFVWLSYQNETATPGPEIMFCSDSQLQEQFKNHTCKYFRPGIPKHGTIVFADELVYHSTPFGTLIPRTHNLAFSGEHKIRSKHLENLGMQMDGMHMDFENIQPQGTRTSWSQTPSTPRSFIRGWIIPITSEHIEKLRLMKSEGLETVRINFHDTPRTTSLTSYELDKIAFLG